MGSPVAWLLNFEADEELAVGGTFTVSAGLAGQIEALVEKNASRFLRPGDSLLGADSRGLPARIWCPTPAALERVRASGAVAPAAPAVSVLREANSREFCAGLSKTLRPSFFARNPDELERGLASLTSPSGWLLKRNFGTAGRGQQRLPSSVPTAKQKSWIKASWRNGGLQVEPLVGLAQEFVLHGFLTVEGEWQLGPPCVQVCNEQGAWQDTRPAGEGELSAVEQAAFEASGEECAAALAGIGYFGPFGIDGFRWVDSGGQMQFQSRSEINARYTLGWTVGFGANRVDLESELQG